MNGVPTGHRIPAQGNALGTMSDKRRRSEGTPHTQGWRTYRRSNLMWRSFTTPEMSETSQNQQVTILWGAFFPHLHSRLRREREVPGVPIGACMPARSNVLCWHNQSHPQSIVVRHRQGSCRGGSRTAPTGEARLPGCAGLRPALLPYVGRPVLWCWRSRWS